MGNRAIVIFKESEKEFGPQIYLHWNGGVESIMAFITEMERRGHLRNDCSYATARFICVVGDFFRQMGKDYSDTGLSLGIYEPPHPATFEKISHGDNGVFVVSNSAHTKGFEVHQNGELVNRQKIEKDGQFKGMVEFFQRLDNCIRLGKDKL